jgi:peptidyl-prolyl cis-trans isomerase A (cyclophilin A)
MIITAASPPALPPGPPPTPEAEPPHASRAALLDPSRATQRAPERFFVEFKTTRGAFVVEATRSLAPIGADRFYNLVRTGFYEQAAFFRVVTGFVVQFGIPSDPAVTAAWKDARLPDDPVAASNLRGTLTFASAGPDTRTTQLFINLQDNPRLDGMGFAPFATVVSGMDVVDAVYSGYDQQVSQTRLQAEGNDYLRSAFPNLDYVLKTRN